MNKRELSINEKIGQRFIFGINDKNINSIIELIKNYSIGGVVLYKKNYNSYKEMIDVINRLKDANKNNSVPLFITIDQEGGIVNRLPKEIHNLKNIYEVSKHDYDLVDDYASIIGNILHDSGINMNLAPVLDIYNNSKSKVLDKRCFYGNGNDVYKCGLRYTKGLENNKVIPVIKHFPGHGVSKMDSHLILPMVFNYHKILDKHIKPFEKLIKDDVPVIMIGHIIIRKLTNLLPASISNNFILKYLRNKYNYNGLIMTDEINMLKKHGLQIGQPYIKHLNDEIWELRPLRDRILFAYYENNTFIFLNVFVKQTQKTPRKEIKKAKKLLKDFKKRSDNHG